MRLENQSRHIRHHHRCHLRCVDYLLAALAGAVAVAGAAFLLSSFAGLLAVGALATSALTTAVAGISALVTAGVATGAFAGSAANADTAKTVAAIAISCFMLISYVILKLVN